MMLIFDSKFAFNWFRLKFESLTDFFHLVVLSFFSFPARPPQSLGHEPARSGQFALRARHRTLSHQPQLVPHALLLSRPCQAAHAAVGSAVFRGIQSPVSGDTSMSKYKL